MLPLPKPAKETWRLENVVGALEALFAKTNGRLVLIEVAVAEAVPITEPSIVAP